MRGDQAKLMPAEAATEVGLDEQLDSADREVATCLVKFFLAALAIVSVALAATGAWR